MRNVRNTKAHIYVSYLKGRSELMLYIEPQHTFGSEMFFRRSPGDTAINLRIDALLENTGIRRSEFDIRVLLFPPEVQTTTFYVPNHWNRLQIRDHVRAEIVNKWPYYRRYDWHNFLLERRANSRGEDMATITILGKDVLPRLQALLYKNKGKISFVGDGLQFLRVNEQSYPQIRGKSYELLLPYGELFYQADFRSGIHVESSVLTHAGLQNFSTCYQNRQQAILKIYDLDSGIELPGFHPIIHKREWMDTLLVPAAFPCWFLVRNSLKHSAPVNFSENGLTDRTLPGQMPEQFSFQDQQLLS